MNYIIIAIVSVVVLFFLMQKWVVIKTKSNKGKDLSGINGEIGKAISNHKSLVLYFFSPSCSACKVQTPIVQELMKSFPNLFSMDISKDINLARQLGVMATPTTLIVRDRIIHEVLMGSQSKDKLLKHLQV
jgi:thioredoxin 1